MASYEQNKTNKLWSVRFRILTEDGTVNKRLSGFNTKREASQACADFMSSYVAPVKNDDTYNLTTNQLFSLYQSYIKDRLKESSQYVIENDYNNHIKPTFGDIKASDITKRDILNWQATLNEKGYRYKYKTKLRGILLSMFKFGMRYYDLSSNPVLNVEPFRKINESKKEMHVWNIEEFKKFINHVDNPIYHALFYTLYFTGCRKSEAFALSWKDIDLKNNRINFSKTLTRKIKNQPYKILPTPKSMASNRNILIPNILAIKLCEYKKTDHFNESDFVFGKDVPLAENTVTRTLKRYIKIANVPPIHEHEFRHSHASLLISQGASIVLVSKRLGHSSVEETLNTYSHLMPNDEEKIIEKLEIAN